MAALSLSRDVDKSWSCQTENKLKMKEEPRVTKRRYLRETVKHLGLIVGDSTNSSSRPSAGPVAG